jgi:hypothetical protein
MSTGNHYFDYFLFVLVASLGTLQIAAAYAQLKGLSFFNRPVIGCIIGSLALVLAFSWFFASDDRIGLPIIEGFEQFYLFLCGMATAILITLILSSIIKSRKISYGEVEEEGLEALKNITYLQAISRYFRKRGNKK